MGFLVGLAVVVQFLPEKAVDPGGLLHLKKLGTLFVALGAVQLLGAFSVRRLGTVPGRALSGFLGGFISSTAYTMRAARQSHEHPEQSLSRAVGVIASCAAMVVEAAILVLIADPALFRLMVPTFLAFLAVQAAAVLSIGRRPDAQAAGEPPKVELDLLSQLQLTLIIGALLFVASWGQEAFGGTGLRVLTAIASLFEVHGTLVANSQLSAAGRLSKEECAHLIALGLVSAHFSKLALAVFFGSSRFRWVVAGVMLVTMAAGAFFL